MEITAKEPHRDKAIELLDQVKQAQQDYKPVKVDDKVTIMIPPFEDPIEALRKFKARKPASFVRTK